MIVTTRWIGDRSVQASGHPQLLRERHEPILREVTGCRVSDHAAERANGKGFRLRAVPRDAPPSSAPFPACAGATTKFPSNERTHARTTAYPTMPMRCSGIRPSIGPTIPARHNAPALYRPIRMTRNRSHSSSASAAKTSATPSSTSHAASSAAYSIDGHTNAVRSRWRAAKVPCRAQRWWYRRTIR